MSADQVLAEAKRLMPFAITSSSTKEARLAFYKQLIKLATYPSYDSRKWTGTLLSKFFAEFEDLQDEAVDTLLDLCEDDDEKTRIVGIQGLASTGKADPRWVKGNTGVLLQLLSSQPSELEHVKNSLTILIKTLPEDVYDVMIENLNSSESETGVSRKRIIEFLKEAAPQALDYVLSSGAESLPKEPAADIAPSTLEPKRAYIEPRPTPSSSTVPPFAPRGPKAETIPSGPKADSRGQASSSRDHGIPSGPRPTVSSRPLSDKSSDPRVSKNANPTNSRRPPVESNSFSSSPMTAGPSRVSQTPAAGRIELLPKKVELFPNRLPSTPHLTASPSTPSLASRLSAPISTAKRPRDEAVPAETPPHLSQPSLLSRIKPKSDEPGGSLLSRLGSSESRENKRPREAEKPLSLLDRMRSSGRPSSQSSPSQSSPSQSSLQNSSPGISILNHSHSKIPAPLSIKDRAFQPTAAVPTFQPTDSITSQPEDDGIIRKGRGFKKDKEEDMMVMPPAAWTPSQAGDGSSGRTLNRPVRGGFGGGSGYAPGSGRGPVRQW